MNKKETRYLSTLTRQESLRSILLRSLRFLVTYQLNDVKT
jgi:hypothetical protein